VWLGDYIDFEVGNSFKGNRVAFSCDFEKIACVSFFKSSKRTIS